ncbi:cellulase family glycosylhydrolase [Flindersiella endophytica]
MRRRFVAVLAAIALLSLGFGSAPASASSGFVTRHGATLKLDGKPFRFNGSNNYYLMYKSPLMVDDVFADAKAAGFTVLRTWGWLDIGNQDGSDSVHGKVDGIYFQYWNGTRPAYNDGDDGLAKLDYVLYKARQSGIKLVIPFTNNWRDFGGIDQYVRWRGGQYHDDFYTDAVIRGWYKDWISHVLNRVNSYTGVRYKDDPTVMTWELGNEPRCKGSGVYPQSSTCTTKTVVTWADEMTRHIKSIDHKHLASVGDEGFYCDDPASSDWTLNCGEGVDSLALTRLPAVDVMSYHLYPDGWGKDAAWGTGWITRHVRDARRIGKPVMLGEFGIANKAIRNPVYREWTDAFIAAGGTGFLYWILSGVQDDGTPYPDYDGFTVYCPSPVCRTLTNAGSLIRGTGRTFPPVADSDAAVTEFETAVTLPVVANDIAYGTDIRPGSVDLDPAAAGRQGSIAVSGGTFAAGAAGVVTFTPAAGFDGRVTASYTVLDRRGRLSNVAGLSVTVQPEPGAPVRIASFEDGVDGWAPGDWQTDAGTVEQTAAFHTDGSFGLHVDGVAGGWFGRTYPEGIDLGGKAKLAFDIQTGAAGTSRSVAIQVGPNWTWCQSSFGWIEPNQSITAEFDLLTDMSCDSAEFGEVHAVYVWFSPGQFDIDQVRAQ